MNDLDAQDFSELALGFLKQLVKDASAGDLINSDTEHRDRDQARTYLIDGRLRMWGYYQYEGAIIRKTGVRTYEKEAVKFIETETPQYSNITLYDFLELCGIDKQALTDRLDEWRKSGWSRKHKFYKNMMRVK